VLKESQRFPLQNKLIDFHIQKNQDFLLANPPIWLSFFGLIEILFQLPFFVLGAYYLYKRNSKVHSYMVIYGAEASLTTLVCIVYIFINGHEQGLGGSAVNNLVFIYLPTFVIPFSLVIDTIKEANEEFLEAEQGNSKKTQ
jgi:hypothetical protein